MPPLGSGAMLPRLALPPSHAVLLLIALAFVAPGLVGHDPWRAFDVQPIEVAHQMHLSGDWIVPRIAGEPWLEDPPFYHWLALAFGTAFGWLLGFHNAARIASGAAMFAALWFLYLAARHSVPRGATKSERRNAGAGATLLVVGSIGLIVHAHEAVPDIAALAAACAALCLQFVGRRKPWRAGLAFGGALGIAFLSTGFVRAGGARRGRAARAPRLRRMAHARARRAFSPPPLGAFALLAASWPLGARAARARSSRRPGGRSPRSRAASSLANLRYYLGVASWFAWPAWPLAAWVDLDPAPRMAHAARVRAARGRAARAARDRLARAAAGHQRDRRCSRRSRCSARTASARLRRGAANALDWFGVMTFSFFAGLLWLGYLAMTAGVPPKIAHNFARDRAGLRRALRAAALRDRRSRSRSPGSTSCSSPRARRRAA